MLFQAMRIQDVYSMIQKIGFILLVITACVINTAFDRSCLVNNMSEEQSREKTHKRGMLCLLDVKLEQLDKMMSEKTDLPSGHELLESTIKDSAIKHDRFKKLAQECKELCVTCGIDGTGIDWDTLEASRGLSVGCNSVTVLSAKVQQILTKVCDIEIGVMSGGGGGCGIPIYQADLPLTIAAGVDDGKSYFFAEPISYDPALHAGASAININARSVTIDLCGQQLHVTGSTSNGFFGQGFIDIFGEQVIIRNGSIGNGSTGGSISNTPLISVHSASATYLSNLFLNVRASSFGSTYIVNNAGEMIIRDVDFVGQGSSAQFLHQEAFGSMSIDIERLNCYQDQTNAGNAITLDGGSASIRHSTIRSSYATAIGMTIPFSEINLVEDVFMVTGSRNIAGDGAVQVFPSQGNYILKDLFINAGTSGIKAEGSSLRGVISGCQMHFNADLGDGDLYYGITVIGHSAVVINNRISRYHYGYYFEQASAVVENNVADACVLEGFRIDFPVLTNSIMRNNTSLGVGGMGIGFHLVSGSGWTIQRNNSTGHLVGFQDDGTGAFFASNYAVGALGQYPATGFFLGTPAVLGIGASTSYWDNIEA